MVSGIGILLMLAGGVNAAWMLIWYLMAVSGTAGAKLSKKVGTDNENTDGNIEKGENFSKDILKKLIWRLVITLIGFLMYQFG